MWLYHRVMSPNNADGMANSVDPDQTASLGAVWSGSALFAKAYLSENLGSLWYSPSPHKSRLHDTTSCIQLDVWNFLFHSPCRATRYSLILTTCIYPYHKSITFSSETVTTSADADEIIVPLCIIIIFCRTTSTERTSGKKEVLGESMDPQEKHLWSISCTTEGIV